MADELQEYLGAAPPLVLAAYAIIACIALAALWRLAVQWRRHRVSTAARLRETLALVLVAGVALAVVAYAQRHLQDQEDERRLQAELRERDRIAKVLQTRIATEVDAVRAMLAERTIRNIERDTLTQARDELARFASLKDERITRMLALIDTELQIRALVEQGLTETAPDKLAKIYARLAELDPDNAEYRDKASTYAAQAAPASN
ncbi:hypothetical protein O4H66_18860 [Comamonadaceae bacterium G21597-S1]|nr:hypothetical protein [Comamonadaceae bacterium G21597-S1]